MIDTVIFDFDGVIADNSEGIMNCCDYAAEKMGLRPAPRERARYFIGPPLFSSFRDYFGLTDEKANEMVVRYRERYGRIGLFELVFYPGLIDALGELKREGYKLAIATGKPDDFIKRIADHFGLTDYFDAVCGVSFAETSSDKSAIILNAAAECGSAPDACIMVGDRASDVSSAERAGMPCVGVTYGFGAPDELRDAAVVIDSPGELAGAIRRLS